MNIRGKKRNKSDIIPRFLVLGDQENTMSFTERGKTGKGTDGARMVTDGSVGFRHTEIEAMGNIQMDVLCRQLEVQ